MAEAIELHSGLHIAPAEAYLPESGDLNISPEDGGHSLPQCDGGVVAWRLLWTMFVFEALLWGNSRSSKRDVGMVAFQMNC